MYFIITQMQELSSSQSDVLMNRFPTFELSYETISHKKVSSMYNICLAIPLGKKCFIWFTFLEDRDVCLLLHLNKEKKVSRIVDSGISIKNPKISQGTLLYGTIIEEEGVPSIFVTEDIHYFQGIPLKKSNFKERWDFLYTLMQSVDSCNTLHIALPVLWANEYTDDYDSPTVIPANQQAQIAYPIHHIQLRPFDKIAPFLNIVINKKINMNNPTVKVEPVRKVSTHEFEVQHIRCDYSKPQYRYPTVFQVTADIQFDIYHLFVYGKNAKPVYYSVAGIPTYKTSVFMNGLFRKIKENTNIDYIEESDEEDDFQNTDEGKYVDINKVLLVECLFNQKTKKWIPLRLADKYSKIVHISKLNDDINNPGQRTNNPAGQQPYNHGQRTNNPAGQHPYNHGQRTNNPAGQQPYNHGQRTNNPAGQQPYNHGQRTNNPARQQPYNHGQRTNRPNSMYVKK